MRVISLKSNTKLIKGHEYIADSFNNTPNGTGWSSFRIYIRGFGSYQCITYVLYYPNHNDTLKSLTQEIETLKPIIKVQTNDGTNYITLEWNDKYYRVSSITPMKIINIKEK